MSRGLRIVLVLSLVLNVVALGVGGYYVHSHGIAEIEQKLGLAAAPRPPFAQLGHQRFGALPGAAVTFVGDSEVAERATR